MPGNKKFLNHTEVDLIFLDIHMPDFTGFDFIQSLKNPVILVTSDKNFAIEAFEYECVIDYLVKPITIDRFKKQFKSKLIQNSPKTLEVKPNVRTMQMNFMLISKIDKIEMASVNIVEAKGDYIHIKTENKKLCGSFYLKKIEDKLPKDLFLKCISLLSIPKKLLILKTIVS
jgi:DNA-binding LytR/AlgR family response regulator